MKKSRITTILLILIFLAGASLLLYPTVSDYWNSLHQSRAIAEYSKKVAEMKQEDYSQLLAAAQEYNRSLLEKEDRYKMSDEERAEYESLLDISGNGIMGYIEIPGIRVSLPLYHGTSEAVLQVAAGHIEGSSLPVGGKGTHCAISGHRGLPSAKLFTDLDKMKEGDTFSLKVLNETLTYQVDQILVVEPYDMDALEIDPEQDYCTLVTCTPYGINTHRLLIRGHRIETQESVQESRQAQETMETGPGSAGSGETAAVQTVPGGEVLIPLVLVILAAGILIIFCRKRKAGKNKK